MLTIESNLLRTVMGVATVVWAIGWMSDVTTTWRGVRRAGLVAYERNPFARWLMQRLGVPGAFGGLALLEGTIVLAHWWVASVASGGWLAASIAWSCPASLAIAGVAHALAGWSNHHGRMAAPLVPILRLYEAISRRWFESTPRGKRWI